MKIISRLFFASIGFLAYILALSHSAYAESNEEKFGDWTFFMNNTPKGIFSFAETTNSSGSSLGVLCVSDSSKCVAFLSNGTKCVENEVYDALVLVNGGKAEAIKKTCLNMFGIDSYILPNDQISYLMTQSTYSVAFGIEGGTFKAVRFSLKGSNQAIQKAVDAIDQNRNNNGKSIKGFDSNENDFDAL